MHLRCPVRPLLDATTFGNLLLIECVITFFVKALLKGLRHAPGVERPTGPGRSRSPHGGPLGGPVAPVSCPLAGSGSRGGPHPTPARMNSSHQPLSTPHLACRLCGAASSSSAAFFAVPYSPHLTSQIRPVLASGPYTNHFATRLFTPPPKRPPSRPPRVRDHEHRLTTHRRASTIAPGTPVPLLNRSGPSS